MFLVGAVCGVAGVLGFQSLDGKRPKPDEAAVAANPPDGANVPVGTPTAAPAPALAPMPHEPITPPLVGESTPNPNSNVDPDFKIVPPPEPGRAITIDLGNAPSPTYSVPALRKGEHIVLRGQGKLERLLVHGLDTGAILDASGVEAAVITVTGKIEGHSTLKLKAPNGTVHVTASVDGRSVVEIDAPGGEVRFMLATTATREGSKIDGSSTVSVTARRAEFRGDITGADTRVTVTLTRSGELDVEAVRNRAVVVYKSQAAGWAPPTVRLGSVAPTASVRKLE
jgi:hypothetical protein